MGSRLRVLEGGSGEPVLLLLHGLGATADVWSDWAPLLAERWPGRWVAPDLPGHGGSERLDRYSFGAFAAAVAPVAGAEGTVVVGHSLGGVVGLTLASGWFGVRVSGVVALGVKVAWTAEELDRARALASRPVQDYGTRDEAVRRHLRLAGLTGLVGEDDPVAGAGVVEEGGRWRPALDPAAFAVGAPDMANLLFLARDRPVVLARGEHDAMVPAADLAALGAPTAELPGLGHNAHVENPVAALSLLDRLPPTT